MVSFYGVELSTSANRPPDVDEIRAMPSHIQEWTLKQLTIWLRSHDGRLDMLLRDVTSSYDHEVVTATWFSRDEASLPDQETVDATPTPRAYPVTLAQVRAAQLRVQWMRERGEEPSAKLLKIANAKPLERDTGEPCVALDTEAAAQAILKAIGEE
jgi:hypothetical protein